MQQHKAFCFGISSGLLLTFGLTTPPVVASEAVVVRYGLFEASLPVAIVGNATDCITTPVLLDSGSQQNPSVGRPNRSR
jgi:hypothetical protein